MMGTITDAVKQAVKESVGEIKGEFQKRAEDAERESAASKRALLEIKERVETLERRVNDMESKVQRITSTVSDPLQSVLGDEAKTLHALRKSIGESSW